MDIQVSSNFERALFEAEGRDAACVRRAMAGLAQSGAFSLSERARKNLAKMFASGACPEANNTTVTAMLFEKSGILLDPHSAAGVAVSLQHAPREGPMVALATAHPAKFPDAVERATGVRPELPEWARAILDAEEFYRVLPADLALVEAAVEERTRAGLAA
jgi:threonine synthase